MYSQLFRLENCFEEAELKVKSKFDELNPNFDNKALAKLLFKEPLNKTNPESLSAHLQAINTQLNKLNEQKNNLTPCILGEFFKSLTWFDTQTKFLGLDNKLQGDIFIAGHHCYMNAVSSYKKNVTSLYMGDLNFSYVPLKLRLAIEFYFKNMIDYDCAYTIKDGEEKEYRLKISNLLEFFCQKEYKKYANIPMNIDIIKYINCWSNNTIHTGMISFAWQNLTAIDLLM